MMTILLVLTHILGVTLGVGSSTIKLMLLLKCKSDKSFIPIFLRVVKPITRLIILGLVILTLSGIGWLIRGFPFTPLLIVKLIFVGLIWILGPVIDNVVEPKFVTLASEPEGTPRDFMRVQNQYFTFEITATLLFYASIIIGVLL